MIREAQKRLVHQRGWLQRMAAALAAQMRRRSATEVLIDERHESIGRAGQSGGPGAQQRRQFHALSHLHVILRREVGQGTADQCFWAGAIRRSSPAQGLITVPSLRRVVPHE